MKAKFLFIICCLAIFLLIILFPQASISGASMAAEKWFTIVLPSLLPFFIAVSLLGECGVVSLVSALLEPATKAIFGFSGRFSYVFIASAISGYPMGAKLAGELYASGAADENEARALANVTSVSGPLFITGAVCIGMLGKAELAAYLLIPHYLAPLLMALAYGARFRKKEKRPAACFSSAAHDFLHNNPLRHKDIGAVLQKSVSSGISAMAVIGGFMLLFGVISACLKETGFFTLFEALPNPPLWHCAILGFLELTTGCLASAPLPLLLRLIVLNGIASFGGLCIISQTYAITAKSGLRLRGFWLAKAIQCVLAMVLTWGMSALFPPRISASVSFMRPAFSLCGAGMLIFALALTAGIKLFIAEKKRAG